MEPGDLVRALKKESQEGDTQPDQGSAKRVGEKGGDSMCLLDA